MNYHIRILNYLIFRHNYKTYLEIGLGDPLSSFIEIMAPNKESCDPYVNRELTPIINKYLTYHMTSDDMFANMDKDKKYDLIFVDGLHDAKQVLKDIFNSLKHINDNGLIVVHDCLPKHEYWAEPVFNNDNPARKLSNGLFDGTYNGTTWKVLPVLEALGVKFETVDVEYGLALIRPQKLSFEYSGEYADTEWNEVFCDEATRNDRLHVIDEETFLNNY
ncbi:MAG: class I SAM-dependent methyltransferase [Clostridia bacterium]|nr:class I SAM-dependent methyltransferase [Clostridia bacterium]